MDHSDYRVIEVVGTAVAEGTRAEITFAVPARQSVTQEIPIRNRSDVDWVIKVWI